jgi:hypothetical protein
MEGAVELQRVEGAKELMSIPGVSNKKLFDIWRIINYAARSLLSKLDASEFYGRASTIF